MRKQFQTRARLVVYMEQGEVDAITEMAASEGRTFSDWMRGALRRAVTETNRKFKQKKRRGKRPAEPSATK